MTAADASALVARTTAAQGLPERVIDAATLTRVAAIVTTAKGNAGPHHKAGATITISSTATAWKSGGHDDSTP